MSSISVVTTTYNERENIEKLVPLIRKNLKGKRYEIIVVDDNSPDGTYEIAKVLADVAIKNNRKGFTKGLITGIRKAKFPIIVTIDADLENEPKYIQKMIDKLSEVDIVVACRDKLPRFSEKLFSLIFGSKLGVKDILSNYRAFRKDTEKSIAYGEVETYDAEFLIKAKKWVTK